MKTAPFKSDFAILDVKTGRHALQKRIANSGPVNVLVEMTIDCPHGRDDGTSIEFSCIVNSLKECE